MASAQNDLDASFLPTCSPLLLCDFSLQAMEKLQPPSMDHSAESRLPPVLPKLSKSSGKSFFPAVPAASKIKPSLSFHAGRGSKKEKECQGFFCILRLFPSSQM